MIKILFFAQLKETLDCCELELDGDGIAEVKDIIELLSQRGVVWAKALNAEKLMMAVNQDLAKANTQVNDGDEVAFFPPVTGG